MRVVIGGRSRVVQWFLKEWREHRGLKQHHLAEMMDTSVSMISAQETGSKRLNDDWIDKWSKAIGVLPADLLRAPSEVDTQVEMSGDAELLRRAMALFQAIDPRHQENVLSLLEGLPKRSPTEL